MYRPMKKNAYREQHTMVDVYLIPIDLVQCSGECLKTIDMCAD